MYPHSSSARTVCGLIYAGYASAKGDNDRSLKVLVIAADDMKFYLIGTYGSSVDTLPSKFDPLNLAKPATQNQWPVGSSVCKTA